MLLKDTLSSTAEERETLTQLQTFDLQLRPA